MNLNHKATRLDAIKARLGAIPPLKIYQMGRGVERLLTEDMPLLIKLAEAEIHGDVYASDEALTELETT